MSNLNRDEKSEARRLIEALAWRKHLSENDLESTPDFEAWLTFEDDNRQAWSRVQKSWDFFGEHATSPELLDLRRRALGRFRAMGRQRWAGRYPWISRFRRAAIAAGIALLAVGAAVTFEILGPNVYQTGAGERRVVTLADGSQVQLDSLTELQVSYSGRARDLKLIRGQARFDVARDVERPFVVVAGGKKVIAIGTAFNVDLLGKNLFVTLIEGKVVVLPRTAVAPRIPSAAPQPPRSVSVPPKPTPPTAKLGVKPIELEAGQQLAVFDDGVTTVAAASIQRATAWQSGQIVVENEPLASVVLRVNRYSRRQVHLMDDKISSLRISGVFNIGDVDRFVAAITYYLPVKAEQNEEAVYLSTRYPNASRHEKDST